MTQRKEQILKVYGINVKYFTFINPEDDTVATINEKNILQVWDVSTGKFVNILITIIVYTSFFFIRYYLGIYYFIEKRD